MKDIDDEDALDDALNDDSQFSYVINKWFNESDESPLKCRKNIINNYKTEGGTYEYDNFSSGERARIMIASCFAFRDFMRIKNNLSSNILVLDEFIDGAIDSLAIESILDILRDFSKTWNQSIYVISHRKEALSSDHFSKVIQVQKTHNISKIFYLES